MERSIDMKTKLFFAALALMLTVPAIADFTLITQGDEVALSEIRLPRHEGRTIAYKPCDKCDYVTRRISEDTRWEINGKTVSFPQFRKRTEKIEDRDNHTVTVTRHIESNRISLVSIVIRDSE
jgi:hypothetical protein